MHTDPTLARAADETAGQTPTQRARPGDAASGAQGEPPKVLLKSWRAVRRFELERSRRLCLAMLHYLTEGVAGKLLSTAQDSVDRLKDPYLAMNRMQRELRRIIAQEEKLDAEDAERAGLPPLDAPDDEDDVVFLDEMTARRANRRDDLNKSQQTTMRMLDHLAHGLTGQLTGAAHDSVTRLADPFLAINRMQRELRRIVALAELLKGNDADWTRRVGAAEREAEKSRKRAINQAVHNAARDAWGEDDTVIDTDEDGADIDPRDRRTLGELLDDLFSDYDLYESYDGDPAGIVVEMCTRLGLKLETGPSGAPDTALPEEARALAIAQDYVRQAERDIAAKKPPDG